METKNLIIICLTAIICIAIIAGTFVLLNNGAGDANSSNDASASSSIDNSDSDSSDDASVSVDNNDDSNSKSNKMRIINGTIYAGGYSTDGRTVCTVYVGTEHANEHVQISVLYKSNARALNEGKIVPTTVTADGLVIVKSADIIKEMPDYANIDLYDEDGNLLDNRIENLDDSGITEF